MLLKSDLLMENPLPFVRFASEIKVKKIIHVVNRIIGISLAINC